LACRHLSYINYIISKSLYRLPTFLPVYI